MPIFKKDPLNESKNITEEELDDENSVKDGSYFNGKQVITSNKGRSS